MTLKFHLQKKFEAPACAILLLPLVLMCLAVSGPVAEKSQGFYLTPVAPSNEETLNLVSFSRADNSNVLEIKKILYLLQRVRKSPYTFVLSGHEVSGESAYYYLKRAYGKHMPQIESAEMAIDGLGAGALKTGERLLVKSQDGGVYPLEDILFRELFKLESVLRIRKQIQQA